MMKVMLALALAAAPGVAVAQADGPSFPSLNQSSPGLGPIYGFPGRNSLDTPTMRQQKLARALALREEALQLQAADGGKMTPEHWRYVERQVRSILYAR